MCRLAIDRPDGSASESLPCFLCDDVPALTPCDVLQSIAAQV
jgi:hypothetical protein